MDIQTPFILWIRDIEKLRVAGQRICPLMLTEPARFPANCCTCDIPHTREQFFTKQPDELLCSVDTTCLPTVTYTEQAQEERNPGPPPRTHRPRGAWTASFRKSPESN